MIGFNILVLGMLFLSQKSYSSEKTVSTVDENFTVMDAAEQVLRKVYSKTGMTLKVKKFPGSRSLIVSNNGGVDGELARISGIEKKYTNLYRLPYPIGFGELVLFSLRDVSKIRDVKTVGGSSFGYYRGMAAADRILKDENAYKIKAIGSLFSMLTLGRLDHILILKSDGLRYLENNKLDIPIYYSQHILKEPVYHYLHKSNSSLIKKIEQQLKAMHNSGELMRLFYSARKRIISND